MEKGTKLQYLHEGPKGWEDIDEAAQAGLEVGDIVTVEDYDADDNSVKVKESLASTWMSAEHFEEFFK